MSLAKVMLTVAPPGTALRLKNAHAGAVSGVAAPTTTVALVDQHGTRRERAAVLVSVTVALSAHGYSPLIVTTFPSGSVDTEGEYPETTTVPTAAAVSVPTFRNVDDVSADASRCTAESTNFGKP